MKTIPDRIFIVLLVVLLSFSSLSILKVNAQEEDTWTTLDPMPQAISGIKAAVVNNKIYVMSGTFNYEYDPTTNEWTNKTLMPTPRGYFGITVYQNKIYIIGGEYNNPTSSAVYYLTENEVYDPLTDTWTTKTPMPTGRTDIEANVVNDKIYIIGGKAYQNNSYYANYTSTNEVYDPATDSWNTKQKAPVTIAKYASAVVDNKIYIMGGHSNELDKSSGWTSNLIYDFDTDSWSIGASIPATKYSADSGAASGTYYASAIATAGVMAPKRVYVIDGGFATTTNVVHVYDPMLDNWTSGSPMSTNRTSLAIAVVKDLVYAMGGNLGWEGGEWPFYGYPLGVTDLVEQYTPFGYGSIPPEPKAEPFPTELVIISIIAIVVIGIGILAYYQKHRGK